ncbi:MAG: hypothetical protein P8L84_00880, partial [Methylococcaceae bacterium]|nr:hypothetical protein [Methylococcaceae bacterium]
GSTIALRNSYINHRYRYLCLKNPKHNKMKLSISLLTAFKNRLFLTEKPYFIPEKLSTKNVDNFVD